MKRVLAVGLVMLFASLPVAAAWQYSFSGNTLAEYMREYDKANRGDSNVNWGKAWAFRGYVLGVFDIGNDALFCPSAPIPAEQTQAIVARYIAENPARWAEPASELVVGALAQAFPCKKSR